MPDKQILIHRKPGKKKQGVPNPTDLARVSEADLAGYEIASRHLIMERDLNAFGKIFGGTLLSWLDEDSYLYLVNKCGYANFVTASFNGVNFKAPGIKGDAVTLYCRIVKTGKSSVTVETRAIVHNTESELKHEIINCQVTFVAFNNNKVYRYFTSDRYKKFLKKSGQL